jgi:hypothetical protein
MAKKQIETDLYTDQRGRITCKEHAPLEGSDAWTFDKWKPMTASDAARFEKEVGRAAACETCAVTLVTDAAPAIESVPTTEAPPDRAPEKPRKAKKPKGDAMFEQACEGYLKNLESIGKSHGTLFSYRLELVVAMDELGAKTPLAEITVDRVVAFYGCERVMRTRTGVEKAPPTYLKTRRVLRQALVWAAEAGLIEKAPLPEDAATF